MGARRPWQSAMTEQQEAATRALVESEQRYRRLFESAQDGILILDAVSGSIVEVNPYLCDLLGYAAADLVGLKLWEIGAFVDKQKSKQAFADLQETRYVHYDDMPLVTRQGKAIAVEFVSNVYPVGDTMVIQCNIRDISERKRLESLQAAYESAVTTGLRGIVNALTAVLEARDPYTAGHTQRVADLCVAIGRELQLDATALEGLRVCALVHDIGKIAIPAELLSKPSVLSVWELALIRSHVEVGYEVLRTIDFPWPVAEAVRQHHERLDGSGYLLGLEGDAIIAEARILAVADTVEAMTTDRPYRFAKGLKAALDLIRTGRNSSFDGAVVDACLTLFEEKGYAFPTSPSRSPARSA
jgi:PAS domain S-box-containing protein/putative nucleotidyltransferase with HDIG domain